MCQLGDSGDSWQGSGMPSNSGARGRGPAPAGWVESTLGATGQWISGGTPSKARLDYWRGNVPWVSPKDMKRFRLDDVEDHVSEAATLNGTRIVPPGAVFIVVRGMILAHTFPVCIANRAMAFNQDVKAIVPNATVDGTFLAHWLHGRSDALLRLVTEATHGTKRLEQRELQAYPVLLPSPPEQRQIAAVLDTVDDAIRKTEQIIAKLKQIKQGLLHDLLTRGIDDNGELRDPERHPEQFKDSPLGRIPREWRCAAVGALIGDGTLIAVQDGNHGEAHPTRDDFVTDGVPFVMANNLCDGRVDVPNCYKITHRQYASLRVGFAAPGDVLLSHKGTMGQTALVDESLLEVMLTPQVTYYRPNSTRLHGPYLLGWFNGTKFQTQLSALSVQSTRAFLGITGQRQLLISIPQPSEQFQVAARLSALNEWFVAERSSLSKLTVLKQGLMEDLLTGRVRVTNLLEQAAE
jgi:type I restriction enzyme, S subunit